MPELLLSPICCCAEGGSCVDGFPSVNVGVNETWYPPAVQFTDSIGSPNGLVLEDVNNNIGLLNGGIGPNGKIWELLTSPAPVQELRIANAELIDLTGTFTISMWVDTAATRIAGIFGQPYILMTYKSLSSAGTSLFFGIGRQPVTPSFISVFFDLEDGLCTHTTSAGIGMQSVDQRWFCCWRYNDASRLIRLSIGDAVTLNHVSNPNGQISSHMRPYLDDELSLGNGPASAGHEQDILVDELVVRNTFVSDTAIMNLWNAGK